MLFFLGDKATMNYSEIFLLWKSYAKQYADPLFMSCHLPSYCVTTNAGKARGLLSLHLRDPQLMQIMAHSGERNSKINTEDMFGLTDWPILKARGLLNKGAALFSSRALLVHALILHSLRFLLLNLLQLYG